MNLRILQTKTWTAYKSKQQKKLKKKKIRYFGSCLLWVMSTAISTDISVDITHSKQDPKYLIFFFLIFFVVYSYTLSRS